jgi:hypothetical protein
MRGFIVIVVVIFTGVIARSQAPSATLSKNDVLIGKRFTLTYLVPLPKNASYIHIPLKGNFPSTKSGDTSSISKSDIEIIGEFIDTVVLINGKRYWKGSYVLTAWDEGNYQLAAQKVNINDADVLLPSTKLNARLVVQKEGGKIYDIEETYTDLPDEPSALVSFFKNWWWAVLSAIGLILFLLWFFRRQKATNTEENILTLKEKTLQSILHLEQKRLWEKNELKEHYSELSFILRQYLSERFGINLLEKTTIETQLILKHYGLSENLLSGIGIILNGSDMVKFAKSAPEEKIIRANLDDCRSIVEQTSDERLTHV